MITKEQVLILTKPFDEKTLGVKVQSFSKDKTKATLVLYLQHTDVAARLDEATPNWEFKVLNEWAYNPDQDTYVYYVKASLCLDGTTRENIGEGNEPKGAYSDALKRCAMLFGVGRNLYDSEVVWIPYNADKDRYKTWTIEEYRSKCKKNNGSPVSRKMPTANELPGIGDVEETPLCELCAMPLIKHSTKPLLYCKDWEDGSGKHTVIKL